MDILPEPLETAALFIPQTTDVFADFEEARRIAAHRSAANMRRIQSKPKKDRSKVKAARKQRRKNK